VGHGSASEGVDANTRTLRQVITAFVATGEGDHAAPFFLQGTGTKNMLVLALLSQIAEDKQNVVFAMEEPETAIPPYAQKRIVHEIRKLSAQSLFTSHSPYVLEEFGLDETLVLSRTKEGILSQTNIELPTGVKHKRYRQEFRTRFCEDCCRDASSSRRRNGSGIDPGRGTAFVGTPPDDLRISRSSRHLYDRRRIGQPDSAIGSVLSGSR